uniref:Retrotransposon gag domain-containing protein n=1 Tax=Oreochromis niloticus TaxID=8128 RepID=A0A669EWQ3_ORENI
MLQPTPAAAANIPPTLPLRSVAAACPLPPSPPPPVREHTLPMPEKFSGDLDKCGGFLTQCALIFWQQTHAYATDCAKIALIVQLLTGRAFKWAQAVLGTNPNVSYPEVLAKFKCVFDKGSSPETAAHRMFSLKQGRRSVADFSVEFWTLAEEAGWEEKALRGAFLNGLNERIKRELATKDMPATLSALVDMCIRLDDHMREFGGRSEESRRPMGSSNAWGHPVPSEWRKVEQEPGDDEEQPMQLGRASFRTARWRTKSQTGGGEENTGAG